jgi:6-pyruvoyltetrahydropterin/6-carboxytetrahydropterin synthase
MPRYLTTKTWSPERGFSCTFRQWRAASHCRFLHGYALGVKITLSAERLDERNWVYDFGGLKWVKEFLEDTFDHTTCIAADDPELAVLQDLDTRGLVQLRVLKHVGCEAFARYIHDFINPRIIDETEGRVIVQSVEVFEHSGNSAVYCS